MGLKHTNFNGEIVLASTPNLVDFFLIVKIEFKKDSNVLFFEGDAMIALKIRYSITFTSLIQMK